MENYHEVNYKNMHGNNETVYVSLNHAGTNSSNRIILNVKFRNNKIYNYGLEWLCKLINDCNEIDGLLSNIYDDLRPDCFNAQWIILYNSIQKIKNRDVQMKTMPITWFDKSSYNPIN